MKSERMKIITFLESHYNYDQIMIIHILVEITISKFKCVSCSEDSEIWLDIAGLLIATKSKEVFELD